MRRISECLEEFFASRFDIMLDPHNAVSIARGALRTVDEPDSIPSYVPVEYVSTYFPELDQTLWGLPPSTINVFAGRSQIAMSAFTYQLVHNVAEFETRRPIVLLTDSTGENVALRVLAARLGLDQRQFVTRLFNGHNAESIVDALHWLKEQEIYVCSPEAIGITELSNLLNTEIRSILPPLLIIERVENSAWARDWVVDEFSCGQFTRSLNSVAGESDAIVLLTTFLKRPLASARSQISHLLQLPGDGSIEEIANAVIVAGEIVEGDLVSQRQSIVPVSISKNKNGRRDSFELSWNDVISMFEDLHISRLLRSRKSAGGSW